MTLERGRKLLNEEGLMVLPSWDLSASIFGSLIKSGKKDMKLDVQGVKDVIIRSRLVEDEKSMLLWALYPPHKSPQIIDVDQDFGHLMTLKVGVIDPNKVARKKVDLALFNQVSVKQVTFERDNWKYLYENMLKTC